MIASNPFKRTDWEKTKSKDNNWYNIWCHYKENGKRTSLEYMSDSTSSTPKAGQKTMNKEMDKYMFHSYQAVECMWAGAVRSTLGRFLLSFRLYQSGRLGVAGPGFLTTKQLSTPNLLECMVGIVIWKFNTNSL